MLFYLLSLLYRTIYTAVTDGEYDVATLVCSVCCDEYIKHVNIFVSYFLGSEYLLFTNHFFVNRANLDGSGLSVVVGVDSGGAIGIEFHLA